MSTDPTSAQFSHTVRLRIPHRPGMLARVAGAIGDAGGTIGTVELVENREDYLVRDITVESAGPEHWDRILEAIATVEEIEIVEALDRTFQMHLGGKIELRNKHALRTRDDLSMAYTPGVARVCEAIAADREKAF